MTTVVLKWAWRYYHLCVTEFDTLDAALRSADYAGDMGAEALDSIEVLEDGERRILSADEVWKMLEPIRAKASADYRSLSEAVARLEIEHDGSWVSRQVVSLAEAEEAFARLVIALGDRVRLVRIASGESADGSKR
ncbi:MAG TPA: hypothetical protein DCQ64_14120 [Candidatus Rokubacteria bacterium]|nr:hypothetical protein [Candidatus Rokubacteria bacterium]